MNTRTNPDSLLPLPLSPLVLRRDGQAAPQSQILVDCGELSPGDLLKAVALSAREEAEFGGILLANDMVTDAGLCRGLALQFGCEISEFNITRPDARLIDHFGPDRCLRESFVPWKRTGAASAARLARLLWLRNSDRPLSDCRSGFARRRSAGDLNDESPRPLAMAADLAFPFPARRHRRPQGNLGAYRQAVPSGQDGSWICLGRDCCASGAYSDPIFSRVSNASEIWSFRALYAASPFPASIAATILSCSASAVGPRPSTASDVVARSAIDR